MRVLAYRGHLDFAFAAVVGLKIVMAFLEDYDFVAIAFVGVAVAASRVAPARGLDVSALQEPKLVFLYFLVDQHHPVLAAVLVHCSKFGEEVADATWNVVESFRW